MNETPRIKEPPVVGVLIACFLAIYAGTLGWIMGYVQVKDTARAEIEAVVTVAQADVAEAWFQAEKFRRGLECTAIVNPLDPSSCVRFEPRVKP